MKKRSNVAGFSVVEIIIVVAVVVVLVLLAVVGYSRWKESTAPKTDTTSQAQPVTAPDINTASDLDTASKLLDQTEITKDNDADASQLDSQSSAF